MKLNSRNVKTICQSVDRGHLYTDGRRGPGLKRELAKLVKLGYFTNPEGTSLYYLVPSKCQDVWDAHWLEMAEAGALYYTGNPDA
jgi:hypothetical protein